jgi:hypothetical protein
VVHGNVDIDGFEVEIIVEPGTCLDHVFYLPLDRPFVGVDHHNHLGVAVLNHGLSPSFPVVLASFSVLFIYVPIIEMVGY